MILEIAEATPSLNYFIYNHWSHYARLKKHWTKMIWVARCQAQAGGVEPIVQARVVIERYGPHPLDTDNAYGGVKCVVDSLRSLRLIADDDPEHLTLTVTQHLSDTPRTVIRLAAATP